MRAGNNVRSGQQVGALVAWPLLLGGTPRLHGGDKVRIGLQVGGVAR